MDKELPKKVSVAIPAWIIKRRIEVMYLIINGWLNKVHEGLIQTAPDEKLYEVISKHMNAYLEKGVMPPAEISSTILNLIEDQKAGRHMTLKSGDYIALQTHLRKSQ